MADILYVSSPNPCPLVYLDEELITEPVDLTAEPAEVESMVAEEFALLLEEQGPLVLRCPLDVLHKDTQD